VTVSTVPLVVPALVIAGAVIGDSRLEPAEVVGWSTVALYPSGWYPVV
jgi:hypothetical protein